MYYHIICNHASLEKLMMMKNRGLINPEKTIDGESEVLICHICGLTHNKLVSRNHTPQETLLRSYQCIHGDTIGLFYNEYQRKYVITLIDVFRPLL